MNNYKLEENTSKFITEMLVIRSSVSALINQLAKTEDKKFLEPLLINEYTQEELTLVDFYYSLLYSNVTVFLRRLKEESFDSLENIYMLEKSLLEESITSIFDRYGNTLPTSLTSVVNEFPINNPLVDVVLMIILTGVSNKDYPQASVMDYGVMYSLIAVIHKSLEEGNITPNDLEFLIHVKSKNFLRECVGLSKRLANVHQSERYRKAYKANKKIAKDLNTLILDKVDSKHCTQDRKVMFTNVGDLSSLYGSSSSDSDEPVPSLEVKAWLDDMGFYSEEIARIKNTVFSSFMKQTPDDSSKALDGIMIGGVCYDLGNLEDILKS